MNAGEVCRAHGGLVIIAQNPDGALNAAAAGFYPIYKILHVADIVTH